MAVTPITLSPISLTSGQATQVSTVQVKASSVVIEADSANTGNIYWGASNVTAANGTTLVKGQSQALTYDYVLGAEGSIDLSTLYLTPDTTGNKARVTYLAWRSG